MSVPRRPPLKTRAQLETGTDRAERCRFRIVRHDGVVLAGSSDARAVARAYRVLADGKPQGWCHIEKRGAR